MKTVDLSLARQLLEYDPSTGVFTWSQRAHHAWRGRPAGTLLQITGYVRIRIGGAYVYAHRLAFFFVYERWATGVHHVDKNPSNNRASNLRECTTQERSWSMRKRRTEATSRYKGVYWSTQRGKWHARIHIGQRAKHLGFFNDEDSAGAAYARAAAAVAGEFARVN